MITTKEKIEFENKNKNSISKLNFIDNFKTRKIFLFNKNTNMINKNINMKIFNFI